MVAVGMNKAAEELMILDERTQEDLASGKYHDQRRGSFGTSGPAAAPRATRAAQKPTAPQATAPGTASATRNARAPQPSARRTDRPSAPRPGGRGARGRPWTERQERLALLYNEQGLRPAEIAAKLGVSVYTATQIILAARNRSKA